jgi:hypothetical protein
MPSASSILQAHTVLRCSSIDRLYLNVYIPDLQRPDQVNRFLEHAGMPIPSPVLLQRRSQAFTAALRAYAEAHGVPWICFQRGERKEDTLKPLFAAAERAGRPGLVAVGVAQERTTGWKGAKHRLDRGGLTFSFSRVSVYVNVYYLYIWDTEWGPTFIKLSGYAPWGGRIWLNGHEWLKRQLAKRSVAYQSLDNGFRWVEQTELMAKLAGQLSADHIRAYFAYWMRHLPGPLTAEDRAAGYTYALSLLQVEVSDTRVFTRPLRARQWFEATITDQLTLGRPEEVSLLFGRRPNRRTSGRFQTRIVNACTLPVISFRYKHSTVKQYLKEGVALRTETTINDAYDFDLGRRLDNLPALRALGEATNATLLAHEENADTARLNGPELTQLVQPLRHQDRRIPALRLGDPRVMALLAAVVMLSHLPAGFTNAQLRRHVAALLSLPLGQYSSARMTYDLGRLSGHGLIGRIPNTHCYRPTATGLRIAAFLTRLSDRILDPGLARCGPTMPQGPPWIPLDHALAKLLHRANLVA